MHPIVQDIDIVAGHEQHAVISVFLQASVMDVPVVQMRFHVHDPIVR
jgi:hypothetical protein